MWKGPRYARKRVEANAPARFERDHLDPITCSKAASTAAKIYFGATGFVWNTIDHTIRKWVVFFEVFDGFLFVWNLKIEELHVFSIRPPSLTSFSLKTYRATWSGCGYWSDRPHLHSPKWHPRRCDFNGHFWKVCGKFIRKNNWNLIYYNWFDNETFFKKKLRTKRDVDTPLFASTSDLLLDVFPALLS